MPDFRIQRKDTTPSSGGGETSRLCALLRRIFAACPLCAVCLFLPSPASAAWDAVIADHHANPAYLIAVDKSRQKLAFFEKRSPFRLSRVFICTTGQKKGDKEVEGDMKTPEGVYFVVRRIGGGLDFTKYGQEAFTLNYPNPVDRLRGKTGSGIWIHGRGEPLVPLQTEGCVAMNNMDLSTLRKLLPPGTPVALTQSLSVRPEGVPEQNLAVRQLEQKVRGWAEAWSGRSRSYFDFYDEQAYGQAQGESFSAFRSNKERLFKVLPWIRTTVSDIQILKGPDYWVTWFLQDYKAPNLSTRGVRRLYWGKNASGEFKILGMEWEPGLGPGLVASAEQLLPSAPGGVGDAAAQLDAEWKAPPLVIPGRPGKVAEAAAFPAPDRAGQDADGTPMALAPALDAAVEKVRPKEEQTPPPAVSADPGRPAAVQVAAGPGRGKSSPDHIEDPAYGPMARPAPEAFRLAEQLGFADAFAADMVGKRPPEAAGAENSGASPVVPDRRPEAARPVVQPAKGLDPVSAGAPEGKKGGDGAKPARPEKPAEGVKTAGAEKPGRTGGEAGAGEKNVSGVSALVEVVSGQVEKWRKAWESGDIEAYAACYARDARQGAHVGRNDIRRHKEKLWAKAAPAAVLISDIRLRVNGENVVADMNQAYSSKSGRSDKGIKTLTFAYINGTWLITREEWSALESGN
ncbi:MAG: L,D-transpeptidase family protein [Desulfovibrio sp.]|jgi:murein L,D-transpeptidase YafK|nr:L,D-transpeptidase family protein [Desulfovibrio sp.]